MNRFFYVMFASAFCTCLVAGAEETERRADHWAWQPVVKTTPPEVDDQQWAENPIDRFIYDQLRKNGLTPSKRADLPTLVRRARFDLLGLPPTFDEVHKVEASPDSHVWQRLVDQYLSMDEYGERWGRHWLDVARYADTKGNVRSDEERFPYAFTYRDYVIDAFNADLPFDQFIIEQIAADKLDTTENKKALAAMGFLTVGDRFGNKNNAIIDDRIDVVTRGFMGLTVACARCHDHKYDPIPTSDYYSLYGVFASSEEVDELPIIGDVTNEKAHQDFIVELAKRQQVVDDYIAQTANDIRTQVIDQLGLYLEEVVIGKNHEKALLRSRMVRLLREAIDRPSGELEPVLIPLHQLDQLADDTFEVQAKNVIDTLHSGNLRINGQVLTALNSRPMVSKLDVVAIYADLLDEASMRWQQMRQSNPNATQLADAQWEQIRQVLYSPMGPIGRSDDVIVKAFGQSEREALRKVKGQILALLASSDGVPPRAMVMRDKQTLVNPKVFQRGNEKYHGKTVPRQFVKLLAGDDRKPFSATSSGRLELARAIASGDNPLTARVIVNRIWQWHFGIGLVASSSNFGTLGDRPSHPELLDYLAATLVESGWSIKSLHRLIMHSETYRQQSQFNDKAVVIDAHNQLLWRFSPQRLDFEATRDALLAVSGNLDLSRGGRSVDLLSQPFSTRRTVYGFVDRLNQPQVFRVFDMPSADTSIGVRSVTTAPQQALFLLNSPFVIEQARALAKRVTTKHPDDVAKQIEQLYQFVFSRLPTPTELEQANVFLETAETSELTSLEQLSQVMLCANEFVFID